MATTKNKFLICYSTVKAQQHSNKEKYGYVSDIETGHSKRDQNVDGFLKIGMVSFPEPLKESMKEFYNSKFYAVFVKKQEF